MFVVCVRGDAPSAADEVPSRTVVAGAVQGNSSEGEAVSQELRWLPIGGFEGIYEVSNDGRVRSVERIIDNGRGTYVLHSKEIAQHKWTRKRKTLYMQVSLRRNGVLKSTLVHKLVLTAFAGERDTNEQCRHLDGNSFNNNLSNLKWGTPQENVDDRTRHGRNQDGEKSKSAKLIAADVVDIRTSTESSRVLAKRFNVSRSQIQFIKHEKAWKHLLCLRS